MLSEPDAFPQAYAAAVGFIGDTEAGTLSMRDYEACMLTLESTMTIFMMESVVASYLAEAMRVLCRKESR